MLTIYLLCNMDRDTIYCLHEFILFSFHSIMEGHFDYSQKLDHGKNNVNDTYKH